MSSKTNKVDVLQYTQSAAATLRDIASSTDIPFLSTIAALSIAIVSLVQGVKTNKDRCCRMVEEVHELLKILATIVLHSTDLASPELLDQFADLSQTLQKFYACLRSQQEIGRIKRLFKQAELTSQLDACQAELRTAIDVFKMRFVAAVSTQATVMEMDLEQRHRELLDIIGGRQSLDFSDTASSSRRTFLHMNNSSGTLSMFPTSPPIFHGRERELEEAVLGLLSDPARVAILGMGGMGKTTLATAALHDTRVAEKYAQRYFVSCEAVGDAAGLVNIIGSHLGFEPSPSLKQLITKFFSESGPSILVLDNLETPWEPSPTRSEIEDLLSHLSGIPHLALLVTMRGAERPGKVKWTRPFLAPLEPLSFRAARDTFVDLADAPEAEEEEALLELLELTGYLPLAVTLIANIACLEGCSRALERWKTESTSLLSDGPQKSTSLEISIKLSLSSPRLASYPHAIDLLSLVSLLPDGISEGDLLASNVPITGIPGCRSSLLRTSLVYTDRSGRIKSLSPIRGYMQRFHGMASHSLIQPLWRYFQNLLEVWSSHQDLPSGTLVPRITSHLGNIHSLLLEGIRVGRENSVLSEIGGNILELNKFCHLMLKGTSSLMSHVPGIVKSTDDTQLHWAYTEACIRGMGPSLAAADAEDLINEGIAHFRTITDIDGQGIQILCTG
ncbi:P-loop containing nucleoside triphosphate hydrolase protein [Mycena polygramma]|nr:P-loop containing nucleoside triphosphate hydrolase protein [Mycena polygramma]